MRKSPASHYGIKTFSPVKDKYDACAEEINLLGYTVIDGGFLPEEIAALRNGVDKIMRRQSEEFGDTTLLAKIGEAGIGRALLAYDEMFLRLATHAALLEIVKRLLGEYFILSQQNSIILSPDATHSQSQYHRDLPYQHFTSSHPLAVNALFCIDSFTSENGATKVIPGSHKYSPFPSETTVSHLEKSITAPAGSFIIMDAMVFHSGGKNISQAPRYGVNHVYVMPFMRQQVDLPNLLQGRHNDDPTLRRLLGYEVETPVSVLDWRQRRIKSNT